MSLADQLLGAAMSSLAGEASKRTGLSTDMAAKAMPMAMAVLMNGLKRNAQDPKGAEALAKALDAHDDEVLQNPQRVADDDVVADGEAILGHILGGDRGAVEAQIAQVAGGLDQKQIGSILAMAAPAVLGALGKEKKDRGLDASGIRDLITQEGARAQAAAPGELSGLMGMFDSDGDGNLNNEAIGIGKRLLGGLFKRR